MKMTAMMAMIMMMTRARERVMNHKVLAIMKGALRTQAVAHTTIRELLVLVFVF